MVDLQGGSSDLQASTLTPRCSLPKPPLDVSGGQILSGPRLAQMRCFSLLPDTGENPCKTAAPSQALALPSLAAAAFLARC